MNLNKLNVTELNAQEMKNVEGGAIPLIVWVAAAFFAGTFTAR
ncbi:class IIb bacteriocin, lactobin A/cerein 7B family [Capnocytophaga sp. ARDL2]